MLIDIIAVSLLGCGAWAVNSFLKKRIEKRRVLNRLLAVASEDFHHAVDSLLKTPEDLPVEVLETLEMMCRSGFSDNSEKRFLAALRRARQSGKRERADRRLDLSGMRSELQSLFGKAVASWFNIMAHKSTRYHDKILIEMLRSEADHFNGPKRELATAAEMHMGNASHC